MTLIISLRIPDGTVIAGDSLSTNMAQMQIQGQIDVTCPQCGHQHKTGPQPIAEANVPASTFSYAQKIFPFLGKYGVGTSGFGQLAGRTIYFAIRELEQELSSKGTKVRGVTKAAEAIGNRALELLKQSVPNVDQAPDTWTAVGFQVVGYEGSTPRTINVEIGKQVKTEVFDGLGCTRTGQSRVVDAIWQMYDHDPEDQSAYDGFSLEDAINYAEFLIETTASYQQFSRAIPGVGGAIDIGLVTPFENFRWIKQKPLARTLGEP